MEHFFGKKRMPMLIIDKKFENKDRSKLSASQAAVNGFSILAKKTYFALHSNGQINLDDGRTLYINRALGHLWQVRFNVRPEITIFKLSEKVTL